MAEHEGRLEAVFVASTDTAAVAGDVEQALGWETSRTEDGQVGIGVGAPFLAVEAAAHDVPAGSVTLWFRVEDARQAADRLIGRGWRPIRSLTSDTTVEPGEVTTAVRSPDGIAFGFISG